jgi:spore coat polysaccharide biosynthesis predicted glycosyltransferase SpsG
LLEESYKSRIVFHIIGYKEVGLGHVYRSLALAKELKKYEILFVCTEDSRALAEKLIMDDYPIKIYHQDEIYNEIINLEPMLVISDILSTKAENIKMLKDNSIKVISFEDLGSGVKDTDLTINELYEVPLITGKNIYWGSDYFFLRDEFLTRDPNRYSLKIESLMISFGGTDPNNLTKVTLDSILKLCQDNGISIHIVSGPGYSYYENLKEHIKPYKNIHLTYATGVISQIMGMVDVAITSNGRTVYELAHMSVPSLVISQHEREDTHTFSKNENGMVNIGLYDEEETPKEIKIWLNKILEDHLFYESLYKKIDKINFSSNKSKVVDIIESFCE